MLIIIIIIIFFTLGRCSWGRKKLVIKLLLLLLFYRRYVPDSCTKQGFFWVGNLTCVSEIYLRPTSCTVTRIRKSSQKISYNWASTGDNIPDSWGCNKSMFTLRIVTKCMLRDSEIVIVGDLQKIIIIPSSNNNIADTFLYPRPYNSKYKRKKLTSLKLRVRTTHDNLRQLKQQKSFG